MYLIIRINTILDKTYLCWLCLFSIVHDNFCVTPIKYIMYNVQDYNVIYNNVICPVICDGWHFTHKWKALAWCQHLIKRELHNGQKYSHASNFPYVFHIKLQFFRSLSWSQFTPDFDNFYIIKNRILCSFTV